MKDVNELYDEIEINESIKNLLIEKDKYKKLYEETFEVCRTIDGKLYSIGAPLNDNVLKFNKPQLIYLMYIAELIKEVTR